MTLSHHKSVYGLACEKLICFELSATYRIAMEINDNNISQLAVYLEQTLSPAAEVRSDWSLKTMIL